MLKLNLLAAIPFEIKSLMGNSTHLLRQPSPHDTTLYVLSLIYLAISFLSLFALNRKNLLLFQ